MLRNTKFRLLLFVLYKLRITDTQFILNMIKQQYNDRLISKPHTIIFVEELKNIMKKMDRID